MAKLRVLRSVAGEIRGGKFQARSNYRRKSKAQKQRDRDDKELGNYLDLYSQAGDYPYKPPKRRKRGSKRKRAANRRRR